MIRSPDYEGSWLDKNPVITYLGGGYGKFFMFIDEKEKSNDGRIGISGTIEDQFGTSTFQGELTDKTIKFVKEYFPEAIERGAASDKIEYEGTKIGDRFEGRYIVRNGISQGKRDDWSNTFYMEKFIDPSLN